MTFIELLKDMVQKNASDLFYRAGGKPRIRVDGEVIPLGDSILSVQDVVRATEEVTTPEQREALKKYFDIDFAYYLAQINHRYRVTIFMQRNYPSIVVRSIPSVIGDFEELGLPAEILKNLSMERRGLVILSGSMGSGKSTTIASMINYINENARKHILTIEEPIEYTFTDKNSIVNQRELGKDVGSYPAALKAFTLQSPDVIYIGNIRDYETVSAALTAAETGVLVLTTLHTINASQSVERIINFFPPHQHAQVRIQLSSLLKGVMSLRLVPLKEGVGRVPAYEVMLNTPTIGRLIREGKVWEIPQFIEEGGIFGMQSFNQGLVKLLKANKINEEEARKASDNKDEFLLSLKGIRRN